MTDKPTKPEVHQRAELARICDMQLAARQSKALEAANLADIAAAETPGTQGLLIGVQRGREGR